LIHDESSNTEALALGLEMKHYYNSQIGEPRHFWIRGQIRLRKNAGVGGLGTVLVEQFLREKRGLEM